MVKVTTQNKPWTQWDRECEATFIIFDMCKALDKYTVPTDALSSMTTRMSDRGNFAIDTVIIRDGEFHKMLTEVIWAGGYNIKCLHTRYITNTTLPKNGQTSEELETLKAEVKLRKKADKLNKEKLSLQSRMDEYEVRIIAAKLKTDEEITALVLSSEDSKYLNTTWSDLNEWGQESYGTPEKFAAARVVQIADAVESWKTFNIFFPSRNLRGLQRSLKKTVTKELELLIQL